MISRFTPPGCVIRALRGNGTLGVYAGRLYTVRGFVLNRHFRTKKADYHVLLAEVSAPPGRYGETGFPRDAFVIPDLVKQSPARAAEVVA